MKPSAPAETPADKPEAQAQPDGGAAITLGVRGKISSSVLSEERGYLVYTPPGYKTGSERYPVIYLFDGDAHFHHVTGIVDFLAGRGRMPWSIVVGVSNTDRTRDFTPTKEARLPASGGADKFLSFIQTELMPAIDKQYRTRDYRIMIGHSLGGLLAVYTLLSKPDMFNAYVAISSSMQWDDQMLLRQARTAWPPGTERDKFLYFTMGTEPENLSKGNRDFAAFLKAQAPAKLRWSFDFMESEDHGTTPHKTVYDGLEKLFEGWMLPADVVTVAALQAHYRSLTKRFGMPVAISEARLNLFGYRLLAKGQSAEAITAFQLNVKTHPDSANVYDSLGEAFEKQGDWQKAHKNYAEACKRAAANRDPRLELFMKNRDRAAAKLTVN